MRTLCLPLLLVACTSATDAVDTDVAASVPVTFALPLPEPARISQRIGVDHKDGSGEGLLARADCLDYVGRTFPDCYDEHDGSDFILFGGFDAMDAGSMPVLAAADGEVVDAHDGEYDRCHAELSGEVSCDGFDKAPNYVTVRHADGVIARYLHLKKDSVAVAVGDVVVRGDALGLIGSSGNSSMPHLHFELQVDEVVVDPYAGPYSQPESWWCDQSVPDGLPGPCAD